VAGREVLIDSEDGNRSLAAYAAIPASARRGAVIIHEVLGRQPEIDRVVDRFHRAGWAAVAPDLFSEGAVCIWRMMRAASRGEGKIVDQTLQARRWLCREAGLEERSIALIGFCLGGGFALGVGAGWGAVSANYGAVPPLERMRGLGPTIACYGERDRIFGGQAARLSKAAEKLGLQSEIHVFPEVGHSFLTDGEHPIAETITRPFLDVRYDPAVAEEGWRRIFDFFERHLLPTLR
jgi:carboxymethylenebutenolidase